ncbi:MAG: OmpA family protein, partial [Bacteroidota bacterium]
MKRTLIFGVVLLTLTSAIAQTTIQSTVYFESDRYNLDVEDMGILQDLNSKLTAFNEVSFQVIGHTDQDGSDAYNMELSQRRAEEVKQYLMQNGVDASDI